MEVGFTQNQIDEMDLVYHMELMGHKKKMSKDNKKQKNKSPQSVTIDQIIG